MFSELIAELKFKGFNRVKHLFSPIKFLFIVCIKFAIVITAFIDRKVGSFFVNIKSAVTIGAKMVCLYSVAWMNGRNEVTYLTHKLRAFFAIVIVEILMRSTARVADRIFWN
jgi:hypothetical protein